MLTKNVIGAMHPCQNPFQNPGRPRDRCASLTAGCVATHDAANAPSATTTPTTHHDERREILGPGSVLAEDAVPRRPLAALRSLFMKSIVQADGAGVRQVFFLFLCVKPPFNDGAVRSNQG